MGFSSALQGRQANDALLARQDAELRLLDIMKRTMQQKAKCDREYAIGLANVAQQGLKIDRTDELQGSHITKAWRAFMDELEQISRQLKLNAEHLESVCQDRLTQLYHDKRKSRKHYQEEHTKISTQFSHISEEVSRKKAEYQKNLELYKVLRTRFEEHYIKSGRSGRKLDDVADKYKKACRKLHLTHNEYVLLINEAIEIEKDFRTILLPGLLEHQQNLQEGYILQWKNLLLDIVQLGDLTSTKFSDIQKRVEGNVQGIVSAEEYKEFTERHKTAPASPIPFTFDEALIDENVGKLQPNTLTVDNLTIEWLRTRLAELETSVKECQEKQAKFCTENGISAPSTPIMNGNGGTRDINKNSKDLNALRCQERQMLKLVEMIKTALSEIGCEELPSGCDDLSVEQSFIETNGNQDQPDTLLHSSTSSRLLHKAGAEMVSIFRTLGRRKSSGPQSSSPQNRSPKSGRASLQTSVDDLRASSVISLDFRELTCDDIIDNNGNNCLGDTASDANNDTNPANNAHNSHVYVDLDTLSPPQRKGEERSDSKNNLLVEEKQQPRVVEEVEEHVDDTKVSFTEKLKSRIKKSTSEHSEETFKERLKQFTKSESYQPLSEPAEVPKVKKKRRKKLFRQLTEERNLVGEVEKFEEINSEEKKKPSLISRFRRNNLKPDREEMAEQMANRLSEIKFLFETEAKEIEFKEILDSEPQSLASHSTCYSMPPIPVTDLDDDDLHDDKVKTTSTQSFKSKFAQNLKSRFKKLNNKHKRLETVDEYCKRCMKKVRVVTDYDRGGAEETFLNGNDLYCICEAVKHDDSIALSINRPLYEEEWFHGVLPREEVVRLLRNEGDFLVRKTTRNDESQTVLSVCWTGHKHFIVQTTVEGQFRFEGPAFNSIQELIMHQYQSELPVTGRSGAILKTPVLRERWELSNDDVILLDKIGRGNFGDVYKAKLKSSPGKEVAVKTCRMTLPEEQKRKFLQEGRILKQYDHSNVVKLIGICVQKQPIMIVMELVSGGSLLNFLRKQNNNLTTKQLMRMCRDAAAGMQYLESKNCIHRDLAARNCLIGDENVVKISDFGMSREEEEYIVSDGMKQIPIKWTAPEALNFGKYTTLCDVWSYGILVWEIFSKGGTPYSGMSNSRARERIDAGYRLPKPSDDTPAEMHTLMLKCWTYEPERRPHFDEIYQVVNALITREKE